MNSMQLKSSSNVTFMTIDDTLDQILRFVTGLRTRKIISKDESVLLEEYLFADTLLITSAYAVALSANDSEYFAEICKDLTQNLKTGEGKVMCDAQEEVLDICESLFEDGRITENQCLYLKHLVLIRDESIADIYNNYQQHGSYDGMATDILGHIMTNYENDNMYDEEGEGERDEVHARLLLCSTCITDIILRMQKKRMMIMMTRMQQTMLWLRTHLLRLLITLRVCRLYCRICSEEVNSRPLKAPSLVT
jgi:hypothetical protein